MDFGIKNKVALVTASSQGLGKGAALSLAKEGVNLVICSRDEKSVNAAAKEISASTGVKVIPIAADVSKGEDIDRLISTVKKEFGTVHILVNNAGGPPTGKITAISDAEWGKGINLTLMSMIRLTRAVLPIMEQQKWGRVVTIVSITAKQPVDELLISSTLRPGILG